MSSAEIPSPGSVYADYERFITAVEGWVAAAAPTIPGCHDAHVRARVVQRIVQQTYSPFVKQVVERIRRGEARVTEVVRIDGLTVQSASGQVSIGARQWATNICYFGALWLDTLVGFVLGCWMPAPLRSAGATILMEAAGGYEESDERLAKFCLEGPIDPLTAANAVIVRADVPPRHPVASRLHYSARPFVYLANTFLRRRDRVRLLWRHLGAPWLFLRAIVRSPLNVLLARDLALIPAVRWLDRAQYLEAILITTTAFTAQPLWAKGLIGQRVKLHMLWYSQNCIPKMYPGDVKRPDLPPTRHMRVDVHWVWTKGFGEYLKELGQKAEIRVVGPILWYLPEAAPPMPEAGLKVAVFDITPVPDGQTAFGASKNYYTSALMKKFITDIVDGCEAIAAAHGKTLLIVIKHKRAALLTHHDVSYLQFLDELIARKSTVRLIDHHANLFGLMQECDLSVSVPYTSTAFLSAAMGKPAIYYDPFAELIPVIEESPHVYFAAGADELKRVAEHGLVGAGRGVAVDAVH